VQMSFILDSFLQFRFHVVVVISVPLVFLLVRPEVVLYLFLILMSLFLLEPDRF